MSGIIEDVKRNPFVALTLGPVAAGYDKLISAPNIAPPGSVSPPKYDPSLSTDAENIASRQRASVAGQLAPGSASSILAGEQDTLGTKRQRLLGL